MPAEPIIARTVADLHRIVDGWRARGERSALVPTMGALHDGHLALVDRARAESDRVVASVFVNPTQFGPEEDLNTYPRTFEADRALLAGRDVDLVYAPSAVDMYGEGFATAVAVGGPASVGLEDRFRPHFFAGMATVVAKLFLRCRCDAATFGEKDFQQLLVVRRMAADLDLPVRVVAVPTVRDADGFALSSRNRYLSADERLRASALPRALAAVAAGLRRGAPPDEVLPPAFDSLAAAGFRVDYLEVRDAMSLEAPREGHPVRVLAAARLGKTRLIDNMAV